MKNLTIVIILAALTLASCKKNDQPSLTPEEPIGNVLYIGGYIDDPNLFERPVYWKDGKLVLLPLPENSKSGTVTGLQYANNTLYACGTYIDKTDGQRKGAIWKNGVFSKVAVPAGTNEVSIKDMVLSGGNIYLVGAAYPNAPICYWKNNTVIAVNKEAGTNFGSEASAISVDGNDVYLAGFVTSSDGNKTFPCYWKNGKRIDLPLSNNQSAGSVNDIIVRKGVVYASGEEEFSNQHNALYWVNGQLKISEPDNTVSSVAYGMYVNNNTIMQAGYINSNNAIKPVWWNNGVRNELPLVQVNTPAFTESIMQSKEDVYVTGYGEKIVGTKTIDMPCYWKNGVLHELPMPGNAGYGVASKMVMGF